ncbi:MAG: hypothetical protein QXP98_01565 [Thermoproteus sp.]
MDRVLSVLKLLARAYLIGSCWECADILARLSSGPNREGAYALLLEAYRLARSISAQRREVGGLLCCAAAPLRRGLEPEVCEAYGGVVVQSLCCLKCFDLPGEEEYLDAVREVIEMETYGRAAALAQSPL